MSSLDSAVDFFEGLVAGTNPRGYWRTFEALLSAIRRRRIRGAFAGGLALNAHGIRRETEDIDFLVWPEDKGRLLAELTKVFALVDVYDTLVVLKDRASGVDVDVLVPFDPISLAACSSPMPATIRGHRIRVVAPDDLAAMKVVAAVDDPSSYAQQRADVEKLLRRRKIDPNRVARLLIDEAGPEYARQFKEIVRHVRRTPERVPPRRRLT